MLKCMEIKFRFFSYMGCQLYIMLEEKLFCMCADELSTPMEPQAWPSTDPAGIRSSTDSAGTRSSVGTRSFTDPAGTRSSTGIRSSTDPAGTKSSTDAGLLAGVAVFVIVLVLAAACIVVLFIWWR